MPRKARIVIPGVPHHVTQRGNNQQDVFFSDDDRQMYLRFLREQADKHDLNVVGYCLMRNHVHLVVVPGVEESLAKAVGRTHLHYAQYINYSYGRSGHLWQNRFYSCPMDDSHMVAALRYVERNPVAAGLVAYAWEYAWSSAGAHCGAVDRARLLDLPSWRARWRGDEWRRQLQAPDDPQTVSRLRLSTAQGWALGGESFLSTVEATVGRRVRPLKTGRPPKQK